jgi:hypothetical protein
MIQLFYSLSLTQCLNKLAFDTGEVFQAKPRVGQFYTCYLQHVADRLALNNFSGTNTLAYFAASLGKIEKVL